MKKVKGLRQLFRRKTNNLARLIRIYASILIVALALATLIMVTAIIHNYNNEVAKTRLSSMARVSDILSMRQQETNANAKQLIDRQAKIDSLSHYFNDSPTDYLSYALDHPIGMDFYYLPAQASAIIRNNDQLSRIMINPVQETAYFISNGRTDQIKNRISAPGLTSTFTLTTNLINPNTLQPVGTYYQTYRSGALTRRLDQLASSYQQHLFVLSAGGREIFHYNSQKDTDQDRHLSQKVKKAYDAGMGNAARKLLKPYDYNYEMVTTDGNSSTFLVIALNNRQSLWQTNLQRVSGILVGWFFVTVLLFILLRLTFRRYRYQLDQIISAMRQIGNHELLSRVPVPKEDGELQTLGRGINTMLDQIQTYIREIYQAQIDQQEANMRALQAQINPHFLYNTLEYIRMSALSEGQMELADVIYSFAALMRQSITQETNATLATEVSFVQKYIYLYQMRFPKQLAYQISLPKELEDLRVPKFTLQPLVENYFVHGVDFSRVDNAIRVEARRQSNGVIVIQVVNNGMPVTQNRLIQLNAELAADTQKPQLARRLHSIGLQNVVARLKNFYNPKATLTLFNNEYGGVTSRITIYPDS